LHVRGLICSALLIRLAVCAAGQTQEPAQPAQGGMGGGIASAGVFAPVYDEHRRPITAGGFVDKGPVVFEDATKAAGLSGWRHEMGTPTPQKKYILETDGSGVGLIDTTTTAGSTST